MDLLMLLVYKNNERNEEWVDKLFFTDIISASTWQVIQIILASINKIVKKILNFLPQDPWMYYWVH